MENISAITGSYDFRDILIVIGFAVSLMYACVTTHDFARNMNSKYIDCETENKTVRDAITYKYVILFITGILMLGLGSSLMFFTKKHTILIGIGILLAGGLLIVQCLHYWARNFSPLFKMTTSWGSTIGFLTIALILSKNMENFTIDELNQQ
jgi:hypothetical protein